MDTKDELAAGLAGGPAVGSEGGPAARSSFGSKLPKEVHPPFGRYAVYAFAEYFPRIDHLPDGGMARGFEAQNIVRINTPAPLIYVGNDQRITRVSTHRKVSSYLQAALGEIAADPKHWKVIELYAGGFEPRLIRGGSRLSLHALGLAWDFDPEANPLGAAPEKTRFGGTVEGRWVVDCFESWGFFWGGRFDGRRDCMHFQWATGC